MNLESDLVIILDLDKKEVCGFIVCTCCILRLWRCSFLFGLLGMELWML